VMKSLESALENNQFKYSPYLGHAYCPCMVTNYQKYEAKTIEPKKKTTSCVVLDESETFSDSFALDLQEDDETSRVIIERHLHHFYLDGKFESRVLKHWIPVSGSTFTIEKISDTKLSKFVQIQDQIVCLY